MFKQLLSVLGPCCHRGRSSAWRRHRRHGAWLCRALSRHRMGGRNTSADGWRVLSGAWAPSARASAGAVPKSASSLGHGRALWCTRDTRGTQSGMGKAPGPRRRPAHNSVGSSLASSDCRPVVCFFYSSGSRARGQAVFWHGVAW